MAQAWRHGRPRVYDPATATQASDKEKAKAVVAETKATMERYKDYRKALLDG